MNMSAYKIISKVEYDEPVKGWSLFTGIPVEIIGELTVEFDGKIIEQYIYNIVGYKPEYGMPFVSRKCNILLK